MELNLSFGECLSTLLEAFNIKGAKLAKGINIDPSLVYKWLRDERVPSKDSPYIQLITSYLAEHLTSSVFEQIALNLAERPENVHGDEVIIKIKDILSNAQSYSVNSKYDENRKHKFKYNNIHLLNLPYAHGTDQINIIKGTKEVLACGVELIKRATFNVCSDTILISLNSNFFSIHCCNTYLSQYKEYIKAALNNGWSIIILVMLNENINSKEKNIFEDLILSFVSRKLYIYYCDKIPDNKFGNELLIVPKTGALYCFPTQSMSQVDTAFQFHSNESIKVLTDYFFQTVSSAKPLIKTYPSQYSTDFQKLIVDTEEQLGDRFAYKGDHSTITIPVKLYEKYLVNSSKRNNDIYERIYLHQKRIDAFETQIKYYKYKDIVYKESIEKLIFKKKYCFDEDYIFEGYVPEKKDIIAHVENIIHMLQKYSNYEVALINQKPHTSFCNTYWMVKAKSCVLMESMHNNAEINGVITEQRVVNIYHDYFLKIWDNISYVKKDKSRIIEWLKSLLLQVVD
jgi:transcriptional regulator with XRE-family HTH domain